MEPTIVASETSDYSFTTTLQSASITLQLAIRQEGKGDLCYSRTYTHAQLPAPLQSIGSLEKVSEVFREEKNFAIDSKVGKVTVIIRTVIED